MNSEIFLLDENTTTQLNFTLNYSVNNTNLTYNVYLDDVLYSEENETINYTYTNQSSVQSGYFNYLEGENVSISFTPDYSDETYGQEKNFTLVVFNENYPLLQNNETWKINITHTNQNITLLNDIADNSSVLNTPLVINLSKNFEDLDAFDEKYNQNVNFTFQRANDSDDSTFVLTSSFSGWLLSVNSAYTTTETVEVTAYEWDNTTLLNNLTSNNFTITFLQGTTETPTPSTGGGGGGGGSNTEHYALKIITPDNVKISDENYIVVNFSLFNSGDVDLLGINLSSLIKLSGITSEDLKITFSEDYVDSLKIGDTKNYSMRVDVNTGAVGKYDITLFGNVTSPKFYDWATFSIEVLAVDESKLSQLLIFTEKLVSENPECLELRESYSQAETLYNTNQLVEANQLLNQIVTACQESISRNEQIKNNETKVKTTLIYKLITTISILLTGFIYYTIRKIRFNKSKNKEYI